MNSNNIPLHLFFVILNIAFIFPTIVLLIYMFGLGGPAAQIQMRGGEQYSMWYVIDFIARSTRFWKAMRFSLLFGFLTVIVSTLMSIPAAYALIRYNFRGKKLIYALMLLPFIFPAPACGLGLLAFYARYMPWLYDTVFSFVFPYAVGFLPLSILPIASSLKGVDVSLEEAANCLGASRLRTFFEIVLPLIAPGIFAGMLLVFVMSVSDFSVAVFIAGTKALPATVLMYHELVYKGPRPYIAAESVIMILVICVILIIGIKIFGRRYFTGVQF